MGTGYLIDSNAIIDFFNGKLPSSGKELLLSIEPAISIITQIELLGTAKIPQRELVQLQAFVQIATIYQLDQSIAEQVILIRQQGKIKLPDAVIAGTALANNAILITRNTTDFNKIPGLKLLNPYEVD